MMSTIDTLYKEWHNLQPLTSENRQRLDRKFMLEFNYNSNHLEGNTLTYGQTKLLLMFGETSGEAKLRDYEEMKAHNVGLELVKREAKDKERSLTETFIRELNRTILVDNFRKTHPLSGSYEIHVGVYKTRPNSVITSTGEMFDYASPEETPAFMTDLVDWYNTEEQKGDLNPIQLAALLHYRYIRIHPFEDGNGRIARLLVNYVLLRHGYPMIIVPSKDKERYMQVLHRCDVEVGFTPSDGANASLLQIDQFLEYMKEQLKRALEISIKAAKGESIEDEDDFSKRITLLEREAKQKENEKRENLKSIKEGILDTIQAFYFPLIEEILLDLGSAQKLFEEIEYSNHISTGDDNGFVTFFNTINDLKENQEIDYEETPKSLRFVYKAQQAKIKLKNERFLIELTVGIEFYEGYYTVANLNNKTFEYGTYPSQEEIAQIKTALKEEFLTKVEGAIHEI